MSREDVASKAKVSIGTVYHLETGKRSGRQEVIARLCAALSCTPNDLLLAPGGEAAAS